MKKGDIRIMKKANAKDYATFDPRLSNDKRTFVLRVESGEPESWYNFYLAVYAYVKDELRRMEQPKGPSQ